MVLGRMVLAGELKNMYCKCKFQFFKNLNKNARARAFSE